jgi:hypothetical protein
MTDFKKPLKRPIIGVGETSAKFHGPIARLRRLLEEVLSEDGTVVDYRVEHEFESIGERIMLLKGNRMRRDDRSHRQNRTKAARWINPRARTRS